MTYGWRAPVVARRLKVDAMKRLEEREGSCMACTNGAP